MNELINLEIVYFVMKDCGPLWRLERKVFPIYGVVLILEGEARYVIDGEVYEVKAGDLICFHPGVVREATTMGMSCAAVDFFVSGGTVDFPVCSKFERTDELIRLLSELQYEWLQKGEGHVLKCGALFLLILHALRHGMSDSPGNRHVERMKRYVVEHFAEPVSVRALADAVGLNAVYCGALFRRTLGFTISEYANRIRVRKAAALLDEDGHTISEIAEMCGFCDVYYFSNIFKKYAGLSPSAYKARPNHNFQEKLREELRFLQD